MTRRKCPRCLPAAEWVWIINRDFANAFTSPSKEGVFYFGCHASLDIVHVSLSIYTCDTTEVLHEMATRTAILILSITLFLAVIGCSSSGGTGSPLAPDIGSMRDSTFDTGNRYLWGYWVVSVDESHTQFDITPVREAAYHLNARQFLEDDPCPNCITVKSVHPSGQQSLLVDVELRHPFPGMAKYTGFDVRGIFMAGGSLEFPSWGLSTAHPGLDPYLKNPDGYTRMFNPVEFAPGSGVLPMLEYSKGKFASDSGFDATLNAYKNFYSSENRHYFACGDAITVTYDISTGPGAFSFGYAVDASWILPGWTPPSVPDDFAISANCLEAYLINVDIGEGMTDQGGSADVTIDVYDWQGLETIDTVKLISPALFTGEIEFTDFENFINFRRYTGQISNDLQAVAEEYPVLVCVTDVGSDPHFGTVGSYQVAWAEVEAWGLPELTIFVDDSNISGVEDGTPANPYNTIQEGVDNCPAGWQVWVDDSGGAYEGSVVLTDDIKVKGENWDFTDGGLRPKIDPPDEMMDARCFIAYEVSDVTVETFDLYPGGWCSGFYMSNFVDIQGCGNITVRDCLFTGETDLSIAPCYIRGSADVTIEYCRFDDLDRINDENGMFFVNAINIWFSDSPVIRNCSFSDFREKEDEGSKSIDVIHIESTPNPVVHNNVIFSIVPHAGVGYMGAVLLEGIHMMQCDNPVVYNNTISMLDSGDAFFINQCFAYFLRQSLDGTFYNNIATHIYSSGWAPDGSALARGVQSCETALTCDYTCIFDIKAMGNIEGAHYFQLAEPGVGCIDVAPGYIAPGAEDFDIETGGPGQMGHPGYVDWDDTGSPSGNPANTDPETRSRMGCHGGPDGEFVGLLT